MYATTALMAGAQPAYVAQQLGHANIGMVLKRYSKWIMGGQRARAPAPEQGPAGGLVRV